VIIPGLGQVIRRTSFDSATGTPSVLMSATVLMASLCGAALRAAALPVGWRLLAGAPRGADRNRAAGAAGERRTLGDGRHRLVVPGIARQQDPHPALVAH